ncbi:MAG: glycosyltransferase family 4 protein [Syntrophobacterales bacterium]|jgi:glycosyltransferase involved in cell wall biosynthesis
MAAIRLLLINYEYPPLGGGAGNATAHLAREFTLLGAEVMVLTSGFRGLPAKETSNGFAVKRIPTIRRRLDRCTPVEMLTFMISASLTALRLTRSWRPDVTIAFFGIPCGPVAYTLKAIYGVPYIVSLRGGDVPGFQPYDLALYHRLMKPAICFLWRQATCVVANSQGLRDLAQSSEPDVTIHVIPNGVDPERFRPEGSPNRNGPVRLLYVGRLTYQKGVDVLIQALNKLDSEIEFEVELVGDGNARRPLERMAREFDLVDRLHFTGWLDRTEIPQRYQQADIFVLPSRDEGMANVILEAMASGLPVIATKIPGNAELVRHGENGLLVMPDDSEQLADALSELMNKVELRQRMGSSGRALVERGYSWSHMAQQYLEVIH